LLLTSFAVGADPDRIVMLPERADNPRVVAAETPYGTVLVQYNSPKVYLLENKPYLVGDFIELVAIENNNVVSYATDGFCVVNGEPVPITLQSLDANLNISNLKPDLSGIYMFSDPGIIEIGVDVGESRLRIPVEVVRLPFRSGSAAVELVKKYGLPSTKKAFSVFWPDTEQVDVIIYSPEAGGGAKIGEHWTFNELPGAIFSMQHGAIAEVGSALPFVEKKGDDVPAADQPGNKKKSDDAKRDLTKLLATKKDLEEELSASRRGRIDKQLTSEREETRSRSGARVITWQSADAKKNAVDSLKTQIARIETEIAQSAPVPAVEARKDRGSDVAFREWSDATGQFKLAAVLVKVDGETVVLKKKDGQQISLPITKLSEADIKYIRGG
jgi:hypothetical protein